VALFVSNELCNKLFMKSYRHTTLIVLMVTIVTLLSGCGRWAHKPKHPEKLVVIKEIINEEVPLLEGELLYNPDIITQLYAKSEKLLSVIWERKENIDQMLYAIRNVDVDGLNPDDYHLSAIEELAQKIISSDTADIKDIANLELLLTDSFLLLSTHLAGGKTDSETIDPQWRASKRIVRLDLLGFIDTTLHNYRILEGLQELTPKHREYLNLKNALVEYRQFKQNGGWETFSTQLPKLEMGIRHPDITLLRNRLAITQGSIEHEMEDEELFDSLLHKHVIIFQTRNGLTADGVVGKATIEAMNIPVESRIASIEANLERWRWLSDDLGERYIKVNIANFELEIIENGSSVFTTNAIVGKAFRETPVFSSVMTYMVLNPDWTVPPTILNEDIVPAVISNPDYLSKKKLKVYAADGTEIDPTTIDWSSFTTNNFPYKIHQNPGPENALGNIKFIFPNKYSVYIHDTPNRSLFKRTDRSFSSGCIRVDNPMKLAAWLMKDNLKWTPALLNNAIEKGKTQTVKFKTPIPVHILYLTAWASNDGVVFFRKDVYNRDKILLAALKQLPPKSKLEILGN
jgi:murein L,D-transpeptidase YcbB/YkuD